MKVKIKKLPELSVFFPAYNEAGNIEEVIKQALFILPKIANKFEILIINDGSTDSTLQISKRLAKKFQSVRVISQENKGYGGALKKGFKEARFEWVFFTDSDLQFDISEITKFVKHVDSNDLIIGFRLERAEGWKRHLLASALKFWNRLMLGFPREINDIDCAFKLIHKKVLSEVEPLFSDGAMVSTELLLKAYRANFRFAQVGVKHYQRFIGKPTGSNTKVIAKAVVDTFYLQSQLFRQDVSLWLARGNLPTRVSIFNR
jgi:glycosyltransferase involved in cell wall biosynthesis